MSDFPSSKFERGKIFAKSGLKLGVNYAKLRLEEKIGKKRSKESLSALHIRNAEELFKDFTRLRGTALKMAQAISIDRSVLPDEFADVLARAQYQVPPISNRMVRQIIKQELGEYPELLFDDFQTHAMAAASLGQVHRATLKNGQKVAIKVQYPNVRETIESDLAMGKILFRRMAGGKKVDQYFEEVRSKLMEETDYELEGQNLENYSTYYAHPDFVTPRWIPEYSTKRILTMSYLEGEHLHEFLQRNPTQESKNRYGQLLWDFFHSQVNDRHTVHADTHPGNFILTPDGKLGILDFGCIKECPADFFDSFLSLMPAHHEEDVEALLPIYYDLELLFDDPANNKEEAKFYRFCRDFGELMIHPYRNKNFHFGDSEYDARMTKLLKEAAADGKPRGSRHFVYIARVVIGLYRMLISLDATIQTEDAYSTITNYLGKSVDAENITV